MTRPLPQQVKDLSDAQRLELAVYLCGLTPGTIAKGLADLGYSEAAYEASLLPEPPAPPPAPAAGRVEDLAAGSLFAPRSPQPPQPLPGDGHPPTAAEQAADAGMIP